MVLADLSFLFRQKSKRSFHYLAKVSGVTKKIKLDISQRRGLAVFFTNSIETSS
jgi:hypothetical protein